MPDAGDTLDESGRDYLHRLADQQQHKLNQLRRCEAKQQTAKEAEAARRHEWSKTIDIKGARQMLEDFEQERLPKWRAVIRMCKREQYLKTIIKK